MGFSIMSFGPKPSDNWGYGSSFDSDGVTREWEKVPGEPTRQVAPVR